MWSLMLVPMHLGALHAHERWIVPLLAFGPFLVLLVVVYVIRRRDIARDMARDVARDNARDIGREEAAGADAPASLEPPAGEAT